MIEKAAIVVGASGGIGSALVEALAAGPTFSAVYALSRSARRFSDQKITAIEADPLDAASLTAATAIIKLPITRLIVATGMLHDDQQGPEKSWRALDSDVLIRSFQINSIAPMLAIRALLSLFPRTGRAEIAVLSARVGSISDNRTGGWYGYRASKAALNQLIRTLSIELARTHPELVCVALHPGTVDTPMSAPFQAGVAPEKLFTPAYSASALLSVLDGLNPAQSGRIFAWDGSEIPA
jgi:NAD(P)-dependent dehydrogenase (short-subunit alcohol dehydrogenase family)